MSLPERIISLRSKCEKCFLIEPGMYLYACDSSFEGRKMFHKFAEKASRHDPDTHYDAPPRTTHSGNGKHQGWFAGTLTKSDKDDVTEAQMIAAAQKIFKQQTNPVDKYVWYLEYTDAKQPHIHFLCITKSGGRITQKVFKRYWKLWDESQPLGKGFRGGYHRSVESLIAYKEYVEKDSGTHESSGMDDVKFE